MPSPMQHALRCQAAGGLGAFAAPPLPSYPFAPPHAAHAAGPPSAARTLHHPHPRMGGLGLTAGLGYGAPPMGGGVARPLPVPAGIMPTLDGAKLSFVTACSFGSEVSVTESEEL